MPLGGYVYRTFRSNKRRNALGIAAVVVSVWLMVLVGVLFNVALVTFSDIFTQGTDYDLLVSPQASNLTNISYLDIDEVGDALRDGGAEEVHPIITQVVLARDEDADEENGTFTVLYGADEKYDAGDVQDLNGSYEVTGDSCVISSEGARELDVTVGDRLMVVGYKGAINFSANLTEMVQDPDFIANLTFRNWTVAGVIEVRGRFIQGIESYIVKDLDDVQAMYDVQGKASIIVATVDRSLYDLNDPSDPAGEVLELAKGIALRLGPDIVVTAPRALAIEASMEASRATNVIAYLFSIVFPTISGILIASILNLSIEERAKDLAVMRLLGARRRLVARVVSGELALMLAIGVPIGVGIGVGLPLLAHARGVGSLPEDFSQVVDWGVVAGQVLITLFITTLFALTPLRRAMATSPAEAIGQVRTTGEYRFVSRRGVDRRMLVGAFVIFLALLYATFFIPYFLMFGGEQFFSFFIFSFLIILLSFCVWMLAVAPLIQRGVAALLRPVIPKTRKLVRANLERYVRRNASTTLIFSIIIAILLFFTSFFAAVAQSVEKSTRYEVGSDVLVSPTDTVPLDLVESLEAANFTEHAAAVTPGLSGTVSDVVGSRWNWIDIMAAYGDLTAATFVTEEDVFRGDLRTLADVGPGGCVISRGLASHLRVSLGDTIALTHEGNRTFLEVRLLLESMPGLAWEFPEQADESFGSAVLVTLATYAELQGVPSEEVEYDRVFISVVVGRDHEEVGREIQQRYRVFFEFSVLVPVTIIAFAEEGLSVLNTLFYVILTILLLVALFSLTSNLLASILEREFEIGVIRSLGLRTKALRSSLVGEGVTIALSSMVVGVLVGISLSALIISFFNTLSPVDFPYAIPWWTLAYLLVLTLVLSVIATYPPARRVAKRDVVELIRRAA